MTPLGLGRLLGVALLAAFAVVTAVPSLPGRDLARFAWFDVCQRLAPRARLSAPAVIVDVDDTSLARYGQWPWPRTLLARLIELVVASDPAAVGVDIVMPEPDRLSPDRLPALIPAIDPDLAARLAQLPGNDAVFAAALRGRPVVLGVAGLEGRTDVAAPGPPRAVPVRAVGGDPAPYLLRFDGVLRSLDRIDAAAAGHGLLNVRLEGGAVRRVPLVARVGDVTVPSLALELFRVAAGETDVTIAVGVGGVTGVAVGGLAIPTQSDGTVWLRYTGPSEARSVSAADVLAGVTRREMFERKLVLVGVSALGLADRRAIPGGGVRDGIEIHAELVESVFDDALLRRPPWARWAEVAAVIVGGALVIVLLPLVRAWTAGLLLVLWLGLVFAGGLLLYQWRVLLDAATPGVAVGIVFVVMLSATLGHAERQRRLLRHQIARQREQAARLEGELEAARRIQLGMLPKPAAVLAGEPRCAVDIVLEPAREVGGDLYDFFLLDKDHLFFLLGDVSGKGLLSSVFMAISRSLYKSAALRRGADIAVVMQEANAEISRDNPEALFVTVFAAVLNLDSGVLEYCNAGHDRPYVIRRGGGEPAQLVDGAGPPLCVVDDFPYESVRRQLRRGDTLCVITDGITDARNTGGELFGRERLERRLAALGTDGSAPSVAGAVRADVRAFVGDAEATDDLAILVVRWEGPSAVSGR
jgi:serine phosphatase RsbU (regulator of sigma subunit)/CHASE2 domain-containing sensor protein